MEGEGYRLSAMASRALIHRFKTTCLDLLRVAANRRHGARLQVDGNLAIERRVTDPADIFDDVSQVEDDPSLIGGMAGQHQQLFDDRRASATHVRGVGQVALYL